VAKYRQIAALGLTVVFQATCSNDVSQTTPLVDPEIADYLPSSG
jgi:hypothetical protein